MDDEQKNRSEFLQKLLKKANGWRKVSAFYHCATNAKDLKEPVDIKTIIGVDDEHLSEVAINSLKVLEGDEEAGRHWLDLKKKLLAYLTIQDMFSGPILDGGNNLSLFRQWYFYYEAKYILTEAILCGLNGFSASLGLLMRLFLEFSLLQNYIFLKIENTGNYSVIEKYFQQKINPNWSTIVNGCTPSDKFCKPIRKRLSLHLKGLSKSSAHPYHPPFSPKHSGSFIPEQTLEGLFFSFQISMIIEPVLWMYFVNFPMLFHPVDVQKKFGFNYPVGLFIDETGAEIIRRSLAESDYSHFHRYTAKTQRYADLMSFYNSRPDMTEDEIKATWDTKNNGEFKNFILGHCIQMSRLRASAEILALEPRKEPPPSVDTFVDNLSFDKWRNFYKTMR